MTDYPSIVDELKVRTPLINEYFEEQASRFAYYGELAAQAKRRAMDTKLNAETVEASLTMEHWRGLESRGENPSEWKVVALVRSDPRRVQAWAEHNAAQYGSNMLEVAKEGFAQRKDLIVNIAATLRKEGSGQVRVNHTAPPVQESVPQEVPSSDFATLQQQYRQQR